MRTLTFVCNICGTDVVDCPIEKVDREVAGCPKCGSSVRMRSLAHLLSMAVFGRSIPLPDWEKRPSMKGVGLSDWHELAQGLQEKTDYTNTYFHMEPYLNICAPAQEMIGEYDYLISSEVFEHTPPPASAAFAGAFEVLKPGGVLIFTVPFTNETETLEHFPELKDYRLVELGGEHALINRRGPGDFVVHKDLVFHGGPGETLEMRVFCRKAVEAHLRDAGFEDIQVMEASYEPMGIIHHHPWSLPISARKPT